MTGLSNTSRNQLPAFTLIEMMVAVAILLAVMAMVGVIFSTAGKASSLAQATNAVYREGYTAVSVIRHDLQGCHPGTDGHAILAISGNEVLAYATQLDMEGGRIHDPNDNTDPQATADIHRADVLMFTTDRDIQTYVFEQLPPPQNIDLDRTVMVTYGHADIAELDPDPGTGAYLFSNPPRNLRRIESTGKPVLPTSASTYVQSDMPAASWHLARRIIRFPARKLTAQQLANLPPGIGPSAVGRTLADQTLLQGQFDVYYDPYNDPTDDKSILPLVGRGYFNYDDPNSWRYLAYNSVSSSGTWWYRQESSLWFVFDRDWWYRAGGSITCGSGVAWTRDVAGGSIDTCAPSETAVPRVIGGTLATVNLNNFDVRAAFYDPSQPDRRTVLDPRPPAAAGRQMGSYFLPNCSDFLVEYTYDHPSELLLVPDTSGKWRVEPQAPVRWLRVPNGQQIVWSRLSVNPKNYSDPSDPRNRTDPIRWPRALRITLRSYGPGAALERPVEQVIIHTFQ